MAIELNKTLRRQLTKFLEGKSISPELEQFIKVVNDSYNHFERDRELLERALELTSSELTNANNQIREEKRAVQEQLTEHEQILKSINENLREAVFRVTMDGEIIYINHAFSTLFGFTDQASAKLHNFSEFFIEKESWQDLKQQCISTGVLNNSEFHLRHTNGKLLWGLLSVIRSSDKNKVFFDGSIIDIAEQKKTTEELRNSNLLLTKTNAELDRFVYSASHDLRAPLLSMLGLINIMELDKIPGIEIYLAKMRKSISKLDIFIKEIIDYSYNTRHNERLEVINLPVLIEESFEQYKYIVNSKSILLVTEWKMADDFYSDSRRIKIILNNLISNAITYANPETPNPFIKIITQCDPEFCIIKISDNGIGIQKEHLSKIFEMFYRATTISNGSGLGLYIVKEATTKLGGSIDVESVYGSGTTFTLKMPNRMEEPK